MEEVQLWFCYGNETGMLVRIPRQLLGSLTKKLAMPRQFYKLEVFTLNIKTRLLSPKTIPVVYIKSNVFQSKQHIGLALAKNEPTLVHSFTAVAKTKLSLSMRARAQRCGQN